MTAFATGFSVVTDTGTRMNGHGLLDDQTVLDELADVLPGVGIGNLVDLVGIQPDFVFAAFHHGSG